MFVARRACPQSTHNHIVPDIQFIGKYLLQVYRTPFSIRTMLGAKSTREIRHEETRTRILSVAKRLLRKDGIEKLSLRKVASESNYSPAGLYEYFKNKDDLLANIAMDIELDLRNALIDKKGDVSREALLQMGLRYIRYAKDHPEDYLLLFTTFSSGRQSTQEQLPESSAYMVLYSLVAELVKQQKLQAKGTEEIEEICYNYWVLLHGHVGMQLTHLKNFQADFETLELKMLSRFVSSIE